jgi:peptide/nickel transport system permease protein
MNHLEPIFRTHPAAPDAVVGVLSCLDACHDCVAACVACADACLAEDSVRHLRRCIRLNQDCAAVCRALGDVLGRGSAVDHTTLAACLALLSTPAFVLALAMIYVFALQLQWLPATGYVSLSEGVWGNLQSMAMPVLSLALIEVPIYLRLLRSEMVATLQQNFIALARGMGLPTWRILFENALRPSSLNLITVVGINMGRLMGGAIIIESMFALPGVGQLLVESIYQQEYLVTQGIVLFVAVAFIGINLLTDVVYALVDPRLLRDAEA